MGDKILKAKHWVIFLILFGIPFIGYIFWVGKFIRKIQEQILINQTPDPTLMFRDMISLMYWIWPAVLIMLMWQWYVATGLQNTIPSNLKLNLRTFKICFIFNIILLVLGIFGMQYMIDQMIPMMAIEHQNASEFQEGMNTFSESFLWIFPLQILSYASTLYVYYVIAKTIKTAEKQVKVSFGDFVPEMLWILFFPIGIWILQPRINKLVDPSEDDLTISNLIVD